LANDILVKKGMKMTGSLKYEARQNKTPSGDVSIDSAAYSDLIAEVLMVMKAPTPRGALLREMIKPLIEATRIPRVVSEASKKSAGTDQLIEVLRQPESLHLFHSEDPLAAARLRGVQIKLELLYEDGDPLTSEHVAELLRITRQAVDKRRSKHQLLAITTGRRGYLYPLVQFQDQGVIPGLDRVLQALKDFSPWTQLMFLKSGDIRLAGKTPLECLKAGEVDQVVWAAQHYGKQGAA